MLSAMAEDIAFSMSLRREASENYNNLHIIRLLFEK